MNDHRGGEGPFVEGSQGSGRGHAGWAGINGITDRLHQSGSCYCAELRGIDERRIGSRSRTPLTKWQCALGQQHWVALGSDIEFHSFIL